ncbi:MAG: sugar ABC transporter permease [Eubacteriales bacterium]
MMRKKNTFSYKPYLMLAPGSILFFIFFIIPVVTTFVYGFTDYDGFQQNLNFVGFRNYVYLFTTDKYFWQSIKNNMILTLCYNIFGLLISLSLALLLNNIKGKNIFRTFFFVPVVMSTVAVGYMWKYMYAPSNGVISNILSLFGADAIDFLGNYKIALFSVIFVDIWKGQGNNMILLLAGLQTISNELYEAANIDGANLWQKIRYITLPLLSPQISLVVLLTTIGCIKSFDLTYVMTQGGPFHTTELMTIRIFDEAFGSSSHYYGYASAEATVLFIFVLIISLIQLKMNKKGEE